MLCKVGDTICIRIGAAMKKSKSYEKSNFCYIHIDCYQALTDIPESASDVESNYKKPSFSDSFLEFEMSLGYI